MNIYYDGLTNTSGLITLTGVPNILTIDSDNVQGSKAELRLTVNNLSGIDPNKEYTITINDTTINSSQIEGNKSFWITNGNSTSNKVSVATSITKALRNSDLVSYDIYQQVSDGQLTNTVVIIAKEIGEQYEITYSSTMGAAITASNYVGSTTDTLANSKIYVDIYSGNQFITTLEKSYYKEKIDFNISQVLTSISRYDYLTPYNLVIYKSKNNSVSSVGYLTGLYSAIGYMTNQGDKYLNYNENTLAQNVSRGTQSDVYNKMTLYTYLPSIPLGIYAASALNIGINYLDSNKEEFRNETYNFTVPNHYGYHEITLDSQYFNNAYYIDLVIPEVGTLRYNVIKPIDATSRCQRIYYHNSYGGVSFFDFTGEITENHKTDNDTFTKNVFDYYRDNSLEQTKIYSKENSITVTMKSHLMERSAVWQFNDMLGSYDAWTNINGVDYKIIITDVKVDQTETGVWQATMTYTYSLI